MKVEKFFGALLSSSWQYVTAHSLTGPSAVSFPRLQCKFSSSFEILWRTGDSFLIAVAVNPTEKVFGGFISPFPRMVVDLVATQAISFASNDPRPPGLYGKFAKEPKLVTANLPMRVHYLPLLGYL